MRGNFILHFIIIQKIILSIVSRFQTHVRLLVNGMQSLQIYNGQFCDVRRLEMRLKSRIPGCNEENETREIEKDFLKPSPSRRRRWRICERGLSLCSESNHWGKARSQAATTAAVFEQQTVNTFRFLLLDIYTFSNVLLSRVRSILSNFLVTRRTTFFLTYSDERFQLTKYFYLSDCRWVLVDWVLWIIANWSQSSKG